MASRLAYRQVSVKATQTGFIAATLQSGKGGITSIVLPGPIG
jgi:hypothetical protein